VAGGVLGVFAFGELFPLYEGFYESSSLGALRVFDSLTISQGVFAFLLIVVAVGAFAVTTMIEKRVNRESAPSLGFTSRRHILAGMAVIALGVIFIFLPDRKTHLIDKVSADSYQKTHPAKAISADELAFRIIDHEPRIRMIDIRTPEAFAKDALPGAVNIPVGEFFGKEWITMLSRRHVVKVLVGAGEEEERTAYHLLQELGYENLAVLSGGMGGFNATILNPAVPVPQLTRWDADVARFRDGARREILSMREKAKTSATKEVKKSKKIQGGC
jgi:hypothetical protein